MSEIKLPQPVFSPSIKLWDSVDQITLSGGADSTGFKTILSAEPTADRDLAFPDKSGTLATLDDITGGVTDGDKGDITVSSSGAAWTIDNEVVTNAKQAHVATQTFKGRKTASTGAVEDLTAAEATSLLDVFAADSGIADGTKGLVPAPVAGDAAADKFLAADGSWAVPAGTGGTPAFSAITGDTNTTAAMVVGSGASLAATGTGTIVATSSAAVTTANEATDTTCFPLFVTASGTQTLQPKNNTGLTYNSNTNAFAATTFSGDHVGTINSATTATTQTQADGSTKVATTAYVDTGLSGKAPLASPALTGTPTAPTATGGTNTTQVATTAFVQSTVSSAVVGLLDDRGNFDASGNAFPTTGGSGTAGAILKGDLWTVSVAGTLGGHAVTAGDVVRALTDTPGSTDGNWAITENSLGYVAENSANKENTTLDTSSTKYPTNNLVKTYADAKVADSITDSITTIAPSQNAVFDALALKQSTSLTSAHILVGNASNLAADVAMSGDVTISNTGVTAIGTNKVANTQLAQIATQTFKGRTTASTGNVEDLTVTQATAMLNVVSGDTGSGGTKGLVPAPAAGDAAAKKVLQADGTWGVLGTYVTNETPSGTINDSNVTFTLANSPTSTVILTLFDSTNGGGISLLYGVDYTVSDSTITMASAPLTGTTLRAQYGTTTVSGSTTLTGDIIGSGTSSISTTIANSAVTNAKMANMADQTFKGNVSGSSAAPSDLTVAQVQTALNNNIITESTTARTLAIGDAFKYIRTTNGSATTITVPLNASVAFATGTQIDVFQAGAGQVTFAATGGVTINYNTGLKIGAQYKAATLKKVATDTWDLVGGLSA